MRRVMMVAAVMATGCGNLFPFPAKTTNAARVGEIGSPTSVEFDMLSTVKGKACDTHVSLALIAPPRSVDPATIGPPALYERAKYEAITSLRGADGIVGITAKAWLEADSICVMVSGRAYRIRAIQIGVPVTTLPSQLLPQVDFNKPAHQGED